jgi:hypothetical protein
VGAAAAKKIANATRMTEHETNERQPVSPSDASCVEFASRIRTLGADAKRHAPPHTAASLPQKPVEQMSTAEVSKTEIAPPASRAVLSAKPEDSIARLPWMQLTAPPLAAEWQWLNEQSVILTRVRLATYGSLNPREKRDVAPLRTTREPSRGSKGERSGTEQAARPGSASIAGEAGWINSF